MPGSKVIKHAQAHRHMTASASLLHSWDDKGNRVPFTLNVLNLRLLEDTDDSARSRLRGPRAIAGSKGKESDEKDK